MPFEFSESDGSYHIRLHGHLTNADLVHLMVMVREAEQEASTSLNRVIDTSDVEKFDIDFSHVIAFTGQRRTMPLKNPIKTAIIVHREVALGIARMFQSLNDHPLITIRVVSSLLEAQAWFASDTEEA
ncbi:hypothetical protein [Geothrix sp. PMB-07]|uniref:hypothetical protein n=1 Tax=Geothrix sp. PMB-07 TaxID=3068640 RepID=UPI002741456D|nr:hypothetical protein [Geothrix sp. PMB-07]WLT32319.1 hypothetical protein Q9293_03090 [Geothrix sp. PMB-07]